MRMGEWADTTCILKQVENLRSAISNLMFFKHFLKMGSELPEIPPGVGMFLRLDHRRVVTQLTDKYTESTKYFYLSKDILK